MISITKRRNKKNILSNKVNFHLCDFNKVDFGDKKFDKIFTVNTIYFWEKPESMIEKISSLLKPGGKLVIGFYSSEELEKLNISHAIFRVYYPNEIMEILNESGYFVNTKLHSERKNKQMMYCTVCIKK